MSAVVDITLSHKVEFVNKLTTVLQDSFQLLKEGVFAQPIPSTGKEIAELALQAQDLTPPNLHAFAAIPVLSMIPTLTDALLNKFNAQLATSFKVKIVSVMATL